jgi:hypothetical protein
MNETPIPELDTRLSELTTWSGEAPGLWRRALEASPPSSAAQRPRRILARRVPGWLVGGLAAVVVFVLVGIWMSETRIAAWEKALSHDKLGSGAQTPARFISPSTGDASDDARNQGYAESERLASLGYTAGGHAGAKADAPAAGGRRAAAQWSFAQVEQTSTAADGSQPALDRQVIRKATIELAAKDVRAAFLKASLLISEARGEYIQDSGLSDMGHRLEGNLTLRVAADRLSEVLNELRQLGEVRSERNTGEDVTGQVVDLEARLHNEQRVEAELLQLLERRKDAPLKEILELRDSISGVRQTIEQLTAQREKLSRLVSLATVLVIIRPADAPPVTEYGLWARFADHIERAASKGLLFLFDTLSAILSVLIGGLVWWVLLVVAILVVRAHRRRAAKTGP